MRLYEFSDGTVIDLEKLKAVYPLNDSGSTYFIEFNHEGGVGQIDEKTRPRAALLEAWRKYHGESK